MFEFVVYVVLTPHINVPKKKAGAKRPIDMKRDLYL